MKAIDLAFIYKTFNSHLLEPNQMINRIVTDSRDIQPGDVFVALKGDKFDAHDYVDEVLKKGVILCLVSRIDCKNKPHCLRVENTEKALGTLAHAWRMSVNPHLMVYGITGSAGKTTVKEMLAAILRAEVGDQNVLATQGNYNNQIGVPLTLLSLKPHHQFAVVEMGMNHFGELDYLTHLACPDFALVNNALRAHVGCGFEGVSDIARAKSEIYLGLKTDGIGFIPCEDGHATILAHALNNKKIISFGINSGDIHAQKIQLQPLSSQFELVTKMNNLAINLPIPGLHMVRNAVAAAALALACQISLVSIQTGLANFVNAKGRLQQKYTKNNALIIDDTYNANPDAFCAAVDVLSQLPAPRILIMGDIGELGSEAPNLHAEVGIYARVKKIDEALFIGENSRFAAKAYGENGYYFDNKADLINKAKTFDQAGFTILIKGSRFMKMEDVVNALLNA